MPKKIELTELIANGVHFGHQTSRWSPKMEPYIWGHKNKVHLIDVAKTAYLLEKAGQFLKEVAGQGKTIVFIGTKKSAQQAIENAVKGTCPYITHRYIGGTFTNFSQVKKSNNKLVLYQEILDKAEDTFYTKKERNSLDKKVKRLEANVGGIANLRLPVGAIVVVDVRKEHSAIKEARVMGIPVVGIVDTNSDPSLVDFVIPGNDDSIKSVTCLINYLAEHVKEGKEVATQQRSAQAQEQQIAQEAAAADGIAIPLPEEETEEEVARQQARELKLRESIKAKKTPVAVPGRRMPARRPNKA